MISAPARDGWSSSSLLGPTQSTDVEFQHQAGSRKERGCLGQDHLTSTESLTSQHFSFVGNKISAAGPILVNKVLSIHTEPGEIKVSVYFYD